MDPKSVDHFDLEDLKKNSLDYMFNSTMETLYAPNPKNETYKEKIIQLYKDKDIHLPEKVFEENKELEYNYQAKEKSHEFPFDLPE